MRLMRWILYNSVQEKGDPQKTKSAMDSAMDTSLPPSSPSSKRFSFSPKLPEASNQRAIPSCSNDRLDRPRRQTAPKGQW